MRISAIFVLRTSWTSPEAWLVKAGPCQITAREARSADHAHGSDCDSSNRIGTHDRKGQVMGITRSDLSRASLAIWSAVGSSIMPRRRGEGCRHPCELVVEACLLMRKKARDCLGGSNPRAVMASQSSPVRMRASSSRSQSTSRRWPCASSSTQETDEARIPGMYRLDCFLYEVKSLPNGDDCSGLRQHGGLTH